jgi:hypothetical protein
LSEASLVLGFGSLAFLALYAQAPNRIPPDPRPWIVFAYLSVLTGATAIVMGHVACWRSRRDASLFLRGRSAVAGTIAGYLAVAGGLFAVKVDLRNKDLVEQRRQARVCKNRMRFLRDGLRMWAVDHGGQFPFNVSTQKGGTKELCRVDEEGFELDPSVHLKVLQPYVESGEWLAYPADWMVCPVDRLKTASSNLNWLTRENVSYQLRSGSEMNITNTGVSLLHCPIHGHSVP